jgi:predicted sulfurtransferase
LSPKEFHAVIESYLREDAASQPADDTDEGRTRKELVLIDVRNIYETKIGRFQVTSESEDKEIIPVLDPHTRQVLLLHIFRPQ